MAYNNAFPMGYQPYYQQNSSPAQSNSIIWVQGEAGAKSYLVAPNNTVQLWDSENQVIYLKSADASGMPSMKILDYKIREQNQPASMQSVINNSNQYVTKEELDAFKHDIEDRLRSLTNRSTDNE